MANLAKFFELVHTNRFISTYFDFTSHPFHAGKRKLISNCACSRPFSHRVTTHDCFLHSTMHEQQFIFRVELLTILIRASFEITQPTNHFKPTTSTMNSNVSKYDMRHNPVYQIDCQIAASGKRVSATKRRVGFRFGFSNREAVAKGCTGIDCRGEEHEVNLVWSLTSGKRTVTADGHEVHFSAGRRDTKFETSWSMAGGHIMKLVAYAAPPLFPQPGVLFRQYDLQIDGLSFFETPRIYELGVVDAVRKVTGRSTQRNVNSALPSSHDEGMHWTHQAGNSKEHFTAPMARTTANNDQMLVQREAPSPHVVPQDLVSDPTSFHTIQNHFSAPVANVDQAPTVRYAPAPLHPVVDEFVPVKPIPKEPSFQNVADQILSAYAPAPVAPSYLALANQAYEYEQTHDAPTYSEAPIAQPVTPDSSMSSISYSPQSPNWGTSAAQQAFLVPMTMEPLSLRELEEAQQPEMSPMEKAMKSLVNLTDLMETVETPEQVKAMEKKKAEKSNKSQPLPPTAPEWHLGGHASLSDIKQHSQPKTAKTEVMRIHAFDPAAAQAGMMVLYGATQVPQQQVYSGRAYCGGPPSAAGFGAGVQQVHYGHQQVYAAY
jgi:hypothetical protein